MRLLTLTLLSFCTFLASPFALAQGSTDHTVYIVYGNAQQFEDTSASVDTLVCGSVLAAAGYDTIGEIPGNLAAFINVTTATEPPGLCNRCVVLSWQGREVTVRIVDDSTEGGFQLTGPVYKQLIGSEVVPGIYQAQISEGPYDC
ncbi:hypothetical protein FOMPIDRAFT_1020380 [Fomitopsis schrenkii]|uniref:Cerato-platanin n=1 Tax=Fomitopsis schrenkii TaxID=2126942 RepID=S8F4D9_FOMSC|nr:hypothetical protein FOMPIDRAFT_1020380 [Fomitopsis schrenkii]